LSEVFGYDKYAELTSEHSIRGTFCDLAVKLDAKLAFLIEVKAIGLELKDGHVKQAIDDAANHRCEWVILTNGICWRLYHVLFRKPIARTIQFIRSSSVKGASITIPRHRCRHLRCFRVGPTTHLTPLSEWSRFRAITSRC